VYSSSLELYIASGGSGIEVGWETSASAGSGDGKSSASIGASIGGSIGVIASGGASIIGKIAVQVDAERDARSFWWGGEA
jgi:hypothetical protein